MIHLLKNRVFPTSKQNKGVNIEDAQSTRSFHWNHGNKNGLNVIFYDIEKVHTTAKPEANGDWQRLRTRFFLYRQHLYKQRQAGIGKKLNKY